MEPSLIARTVATAAAMFAATNLDDAVVLTMFNAASRSSGAPKQWQIWVGQYIGIALMVVVALIGAFGLGFVSLHWVGLLGLIPLARGLFGVWVAVRARRAGEVKPPSPAASLLGVISVTFADGGDNITVYTAAFRIQGSAETALTIAVFAAGVAVWCLAAFLLVSRRRLVDALQRHSTWIVPAVYIALGLFVIVRSGLLAALLGWCEALSRAAGG